MIGGMIVDENGQTKMLVHYAYKVGKKITLACLPRTAPNGRFQYSNDIRACNCPICHRTTVFQEQAK